MTSVTHCDDTTVGRILGGPTDEIRCNGRHDTAEAEEPCESSEDRRDETAGDLHRAGSTAERRRRRHGDVVEKRSDSCESVDRNEQPLLESESHGVRTQVVAELVGEHTAQRVVIEFTGGERGHDDQVTTAGEGVEIVVVDHSDGESVVTDVQGLGHFVEGPLEAERLVAGGTAGPDQSGENPALNHRDEEQSTGHHVDGHRGEVPDRDEAADQPPERGHRQEKDGQDGHQGNQARDGGPIDTSLAGSHPRHCGRPDRP